MMAASQRNQKEAFHELMRASRDKANEIMFANIKSYDGKYRQIFEDRIDEINQACWVSNHDFRTEIIKKLTGVVRQVVMACRNFSDDALLTKLRGCFSGAPTMNEAREELRNMRQKENESTTIYIYRRWKTSPHHQGFHDISQREHQEKDHQQMGRDEKSTQDNPGCFQVANDVESWLQVANSFKLELSNNFPLMEVNEISADEISGDKFEVNEISRGKKWGNNNNSNYKQIKLQY